MWFKSIPIISNIPIFDEIMTNEYPKFDDKTNYTSSIVEFVNKIFDDITYLKKQKEFIEFVLSKYIETGVEELDQEKLPILLTNKYQSLEDAKSILGDVANISRLFIEFQEHLYKQSAA